MMFIIIMLSTIVWRLTPFPQYCETAYVLFRYYKLTMNAHKINGTDAPLGHQN